MPLGSSLAFTFSPTGPSSTASASFTLAKRKGVSHTAISGTMPTRVAVEPTIISCAPPMSALLHLRVGTQRGVADGAHLHLAARGLLDLLGEEAHGAPLVGVVHQAVAEAHDARLEILGLGDGRAAGGDGGHERGEGETDAHGVCLLDESGKAAKTGKADRYA